jgi:SNF2 family DNA or RNA helicase
LWPQLQILHAEEHNWWNTEDEFHDKYVKRGGSRENAELHTMLTSTIMIRRLKDDILKTLPRKHRAMASLHVLSKEKSTEFKGLLEQLRQGKGKLGELAREHHAESLNRQETAGDGESDALVPGQIGMFSTEFMDQIKALDLDLRQRFEEGRQHIRVLLAPQIAHLDAERQSAVLLQSEGQLYADLERTRRERLAQIAADTANENESKRNVLSQLYCLSGEVKIPVVVDLLNRWLRDPTKGKLCIFAHHISVLNAIRDLSELSNDSESTQKYIRIDGSTNPLSRQEQINAFQTDPLVKVALLGITAAGYVRKPVCLCLTFYLLLIYQTFSSLIQCRSYVDGIIDSLVCRTFLDACNCHSS